MVQQEFNASLYIVLKREHPLQDLLSFRLLHIPKETRFIDFQVHQKPIFLMAIFGQELRQMWVGFLSGGKVVRGSLN